MAKWLEQASQSHEMYCHDLEVMSSNPGRGAQYFCLKSNLNQKVILHMQALYFANTQRV